MPKKHVKTLLLIGQRLSLMLIGMVIYCFCVDFVLRWAKIENLYVWGAEAGLVNGVILGLLMTFRNRAAFDRWWEGRRMWGQLVNESRNLAVKLATFLPHETLERSRVAALIIGFAYALKRHLRGDLPRLREIAGMEQETDDPPHLPTYIVQRLYREVSGWRRDRQVDDGTLWIIDPHLRAFLDVCGGCERIRNTPLPPSYVLMLRIGLVMNLLVAPWYMIADVGLLSIPAILLISFFLLGVELIDSMVEEPFGRDQDDLDLDRYCQTIQQSVRQSLPMTAAVEPLSGA